MQKRKEVKNLLNWKILEIVGNVFYDLSTLGLLPSLILFITKTNHGNQVLICDVIILVLSVVVIYASDTLKNLEYIKRRKRGKH